MGGVIRRIFIELVMTNSLRLVKRVRTNKAAREDSFAAIEF
jgi:hypothetical protein